MTDAREQPIGDARDEAVQSPAPDGMVFMPFDGQPLGGQPVAPAEEEPPYQETVVNESA